MYAIKDTKFDTYFYRYDFSNNQVHLLFLPKDTGYICCWENKNQAIEYMTIAQKLGYLSNDDICVVEV